MKASPTRGRSAESKPVLVSPGDFIDVNGVRFVNYGIRPVFFDLASGWYWSELDHPAATWTLIPVRGTTPKRGKHGTR